jgi:hypothetical protein
MQLEARRVLARSYLCQTQIVLKGFQQEEGTVVLHWKVVRQVQTLGQGLWPCTVQ